MNDGLGDRLRHVTPFGQEGIKIAECLLGLCKPSFRDTLTFEQKLPQIGVNLVAGHVGELSHLIGGEVIVDEDLHRLIIVHPILTGDTAVLQIVLELIQQEVSLLVDCLDVDPSRQLLLFLILLVILEVFVLLVEILLVILEVILVVIVQLVIIDHILVFLISEALDPEHS